MILTEFMIESIFLISSVLSIPIQHESISKRGISTTLETNTPSTADNDQKVPLSRSPQAKSKQLIITPMENPIIIAPIRTQQDLISNEEEDPNDLTEIIHENGETMQPAENIIFRPLFSYRSLQAKRKRYNESKRTTSKPPNVEDNTIRRRSYTPQEVPLYYPYPRPFYYYNGAYYYPNY